MDSVSGVLPELMFSFFFFCSSGILTVYLGSVLHRIFSRMESLSELQNPLLAKNNGHLHGNYTFHQHSHQDYAGHRCPGKLYSYIFQNSGNARTHQLLDASSLQLAVEALYGPNFILVKDETSVKVKDNKVESCETTFTENKEAPIEPSDGQETQGRSLMENDIKIQTVSYEVEEEEFQEYEVCFIGYNPNAHWGLTSE